MFELDDNVIVKRGELLFWRAYLMGPIALLIAWIIIWLPRIWEFSKGVITGIKLAYKEAKK